MWSLHVLPVCVGSPVILASSHSPNTQMGLGKLTIGMNVSMNACLSLFVSSVVDWRPLPL